MPANLIYEQSTNFVQSSTYYNFMLKIERKEPTYADLINFQVKKGCNKKEICAGSMPPATLNKLLPYLKGQGLQIGGFVGITHCFLAIKLKTRATIWTVDPNLPHRGINRPFELAYNMASHYQLLRNSVFITNYANEQISIFQESGMLFDFIILDGNHDEKQVRNEVEECKKILKIGGYLILDDIDFWQGPKKVYNTVDNKQFEKIPLTNRAGLLKKLEG